MESKSRSIVKTVLYRVLIIIVSAIILWVATKSFEFSFGISLVIGLVNAVVYYFFERGWSRIKWGYK